LLEGYQLLRAGIVGPGFERHPAKLMWVGYETSFVVDYLGAIYFECINRSIDAYELKDKIDDFFDEHFPTGSLVSPPWLTDPVLADRVITSHRYRLYLKDPIYYSQWAGDEPYYKRSVCCPVRKGKPNGCDYFWYSHHVDNNS